MSRRRAGGLEFLLSAILALVLLFMSTVLLSRHDVVRDLSAGQRRTLAPQTLSVVGMIERPIQITAFYADEPQEQARLLNLIERYREHTALLDLRVRGRRPPSGRRERVRGSRPTAPSCSRTVTCGCACPIPTKPH